MHVPRHLAQRLNPLIGQSCTDTLCNVRSLLDGQAALIADRSSGTTLDAELMAQLLALTSAAVSYEADQPLPSPPQPLL